MIDNKAASQVRALLDLGMSYYQQESLDKAERVLREALVLQPDNVDIRACLGTLLLKRGAADLAIDMLTSTVRLSPGHVSAHNNLGIALHQQKRLPEAIQAFSVVLQQRPDHAGAMRNLGLILNDTGAFEKAAGFLNRAVKIQPEVHDAWFNLGRAYYGIGKISDAVTSFRKAISLNRNSAAAYNGLGISLLESGEIEAATTALQSALKCRPDYAVANYNLGNALRLGGRLIEAQCAYEETTRLNPGYMGAHYNLGLTLMLQGELEKSEKSYRRAIECHTKNAEALVSLGDVLLQQDKLAEAEQAYQEALAIDGMSMDAFAGLARLMELTGKLDKAWKLIEQGLKLAPLNAGLNLAAAKCERRSGKHEQAIKRLEALGSSNNFSIDSDIKYELGFLHELSGNAKRAYQYADQANQLHARLWNPPHAGNDAFVDHTTRLAEMFTVESVANWRNQEVVALQNNPVFLIGFPRSGTTLLDQVLDSHPMICTLEEKPMVQAMDSLLDRYPGGYYENLATLTPGQTNVLREKYFEVASDYISPQEGQIVIDKFPLNITQTGFMWRVFPGAKYILAIRHPCDVCISCFRQNFALNDAMSHFLSLEDTVALYTKVMQTWKHYIQLLPVEYHLVRYEDLVDDLEREARSVVSFLGQEWDPVVMDYVKHARSRDRINTPSYTQVLNPIYTHAKYRWQRYAEQINPYIEQLQPFITYFGYDEV